jgi:hypothetical protein
MFCLLIKCEITYKTLLKIVNVITLWIYIKMFIYFSTDIYQTFYDDYLMEFGGYGLQLEEVEEAVSSTETSSYHLQELKDLIFAVEGFELPFCNVTTSAEKSAHLLRHYPF